MKKSTFLIAGKHAVAEALKNPNRKVLKVFLTEESKKNLNRDNQDLNLLKNIKLRNPSIHQLAVERVHFAVRQLNTGNTLVCIDR